MNPSWFAVAGGGLIILLASVAKARMPTIGPGEARVFHAVNGLPNFLFRCCGLSCNSATWRSEPPRDSIVAIFDRDSAVALGVLLAMVFKLVSERIVRREMADYLAVRQRPGTSEVGAIVRGKDVPLSGPSFPSGHVILVAAVGTVVSPNLPSAWWWLPAVLMVLVMVGRVYVAAHNPLDVTAGLGAGLLLGGILAAFVN